MARNDLERSRVVGWVVVLGVLVGATLAAGGLLGFYAPVWLR
ncbi:MAG TPA: hypothetical protein RMG48_22705 [Myxococcales bacterium LLY-WYZ-16_1]|jgi:hypothetical protein|nr:hypothetical protein [Myxococcales bacterium LLY-WYZ-16_1]